jgi:hypothetical protein
LLSIVLLNAKRISCQYCQLQCSPRAVSCNHGSSLLSLLITPRLLKTQPGQLPFKGKTGNNCSSKVNRVHAMQTFSTDQQLSEWCEVSASALLLLSLHRRLCVAALTQELTELYTVHNRRKKISRIN